MPQYHLFSSFSDPAKRPAENVKVINPADRNTDIFLGALKNQVIILEQEPKPTAKFDSSDEWSKWLNGLGTSAEFSLTLDDSYNKVKHFDFTLTIPLGKVTFRSTTGALNFSFGAPTIIGVGNDEARVPAPGIDESGNMLYCGIDPTKTDILKCSVKDVFDYVGGGSLLKALPSVLSGLSVTLDPNDTAAIGGHNALWFSPSVASKTAIRLQFKLDHTDTLQQVLNKALPGLEIFAANVICKKILVAGETAKGPIAVDQGQVEFQFGCKVTPQIPAGQLPVEMIAGIVFHSTGLTLTLTLKSKDALTGILGWLGGLVPSELGGPIDLVTPIQNILQSSEGIFPKFQIRRVRVSLDTSSQSSTPSLSSLGIDIEVPATFGQPSTSSVYNTVFLITYSWSSIGGKLGSIRGQLWNWFDSSNDADLSPFYEQWADLKPLTENPASAIDLASLISGNKIENIPDTIPTQLTRAAIYLSQDSFAIGATVTANGPQGLGSAPQPYLGEVSINASYAWGKKSDFRLSIGILAGLRPSSTSKDQTTATMSGSLDYSSAAKKWELKAGLRGLHASILYEFFDKSSAENVMPLIDSIVINSLDVNYVYTGNVGSIFDIKGDLWLGPLKLDLTFHYAGSWTFTADLKSGNTESTIGTVLESILGDDDLDIPDFIGNHKFGSNDGLSLVVKKGEPATGPADATAKPQSFHFIVRMTIGDVSLLFVQYRNTAWAPNIPSKRLFKVALKGLPPVDIPLVGNITQPFDEMYYMWVQDGTKQNKSNPAGLTRKEIADINKIFPDNAKLVANDKFKDKDDENLVPIAAGSHFAIVIKDPKGDRICILDYDFKAESKEKPKNVEAEYREEKGAMTTTSKANNESPPSSAQAPFKKNAGPLSLSNIGLKYADKKVHILLDATFVLGPVGFALLGFTIEIEIHQLNDPTTWKIGANIEGFAASFEKAPLTIAGIIRHGKTDEMDYYAGGLIFGFVPYQFEAAGFYGAVTPPGKKSFNSFFVFAKLNGPLVTLAFAEISGVTAGFGYNSQVRIPTPEQIVDFPFIAPSALEGSGSALEALQKLTDPNASAGGWFNPADGTYWAAAGMKVDAFQMISLDAVLVVQFGNSLKLGIFAVALADVPTAKSPVKFAHVELGIAIVVDFDYGILKAEGQLSPKSYVLHPDCHLTGGFGLYYWFDAPHADPSQIGNFVFTIGGYHQAYEVPEGYPKPPRLGISWSIGSTISITGQAYFAITPKACMGGGRLHASFRAGPIEAWFDAFADFLINYKPFSFVAGAKICVGVAFNIDFWFIHTRISAEISAQLELWGPPVAGRVRVNFWIASFNINFGDSKKGVDPVSLILFYELVLQAASQQKSLSAPEISKITEILETKTDMRPKNEAHTFLPQTGLMNGGEDPRKESHGPWLVRGGNFSFAISSVMAVNTAKFNKKDVAYWDNNIFAKPMKLKSPMSSSMTLKHFRDGKEQANTEWRMEVVLKSVPSGLWEKYDEGQDPSNGNNNIGSLLDPKDSGAIPLMMGVYIIAPRAIMSADKLPVFETADSALVKLVAKKTFPKTEESSKQWQAVAPIDGVEQWKKVETAWNNPSLGTGDDGQAGFIEKWAGAFNWDKVKLKSIAGIPKRMSHRFDDLFVAAPLLTK